MLTSVVIIYRAFQCPSPETLEKGTRGRGQERWRGRQSVDHECGPHETISITSNSRARPSENLGSQFLENQ